ncbi:hypothetical protein AA313_de0201855 [Arthrobotrys entomopaga]|nr:hypothetical protein AA313_de0201855 [Arthrobotrys entomopaga]
MVNINREGFTLLTPQEDGASSPAGTLLNIVFIHGLRGHPRNTWTACADLLDAAGEAVSPGASERQMNRISLFWRRKNKTDPTGVETLKPPASSEVFWPEEYLVPDIPQARIWTYGYNADVVGGLFQSNSKNSISQHGRDLADPIIFVAHSLGGIILKDVYIAPYTKP